MSTDSRNTASTGTGSGDTEPTGTGSTGSRSSDAGHGDAAPPRRQTRQRAAVLEALEQGREFVSAQQLHDQLRHAGTPVGLATVYRTLQAMADTGELDSVRDEAGETRFRRCAATAHHHHLVCRHCGRTVELAASAVEAWANQVGGEHGFIDVQHRVELFGVCAQCATG